MNDTSPGKSDNKNLDQTAPVKETKDPSVENGQKIIDISKEVEKTDEEDSKKDAEQWRNEG